MTNEKDREEALKVLAIFSEAACPGYHFFAMPEKQAGLEEAAAFVARIRAEAVKAERERCISAVRAERITPENTDVALLCEEDYAYNRAIEHAIKAILSDDQEANRG